MAANPIRCGRRDLSKLPHARRPASLEGIHDKDMVASGLSSTASVIGIVDGEGIWSWVTNEQRILAELTATNVGAGHRLPSYTTPEIRLIMQQMDSAGGLIEGTKQETIIARRMTPNLSEEVFDTRLLLGESLTLNYDQQRDSEAQFLRAWVEVWPDETYRRNYEAWLKQDKFPNGRTLLESAHQASIDSRYELWRKIFLCENQRSVQWGRRRSGRRTGIGISSGCRGCTTPSIHCPSFSASSLMRSIGRLGGFGTGLSLVTRIV